MGWGKRLAASIVRQDVARLLLSVADRAPVTANRLRSVLVKLFNWAVDNALLDNSPATGTRKPTKESRGKTRTLSDAEIKLLWPAFDRVRAHAWNAAAFRILLLSGKRPGEVVGMAADELHDLDDPRAALWSIPAWRMKGRRPHLVPLPPLACSIIRGELARRENPEFVFASRYRSARAWLGTAASALAGLIAALNDSGPTRRLWPGSRPIGRRRMIFAGRSFPVYPSLGFPAKTA